MEKSPKVSCSEGKRGPTDEARVAVVVEEGDAIFLLFGDMDLADPKTMMEQDPDPGGRGQTISMDALTSGLSLESTLEFTGTERARAPSPPEPPKEEPLSLANMPDLAAMAAAGVASLPDPETASTVIEEGPSLLERVAAAKAPTTAAAMTARQEAEAILARRARYAPSGPLRAEDLEEPGEEKTESTEGTLWWWPVVQKPNADPEEPDDSGALHVIRSSQRAAAPKTIPADAISPITSIAIPASPRIDLPRRQPAKAPPSTPGPVAAPPPAKLVVIALGILVLAGIAAVTFAII